MKARILLLPLLALASCNAAPKCDLRKLEIGIPAEEAMRLCGKPDAINGTNTGTNIHEQWVYGHRNYIYIDHGIVEMTQYEGKNHGL